MTMRDWERRRFVERNAVAAFAAAANVAIRTANMTVDWDDTRAPVAWNRKTQDRRIRAPTRGTPRASHRCSTRSPTRSSTGA